MTEAKRKIKKAVADYKKMFPVDYSIVCDAVAVKRDMTDSEFALVQGTDTEMRALFEIPETLNNMIVAALDTEQILWFKTGVKSAPNQGGRWFAHTFPEFAIARKI